jgi:hypothetical protein
MYQRDHIAISTPTSTADGNHTVRQRLDRHPTASNTTVMVTAWTSAGTQPCINEIRWVDARTISVEGFTELSSDMFLRVC